MTQVQKNILAKLEDGQIISLNYKNPGGLKLVTLNTLRKLGFIEFTRVKQPHLSSKSASYKIKLIN